MYTLYQKLKSYGLGSRETIKEKVFALTEKRLGELLGQYVDIAQNAPHSAKPLVGAMDIYPDSQSNTLSTDTIKRLSLCANRIYVHDDLLALGLDWSEIDGMHRMAQTRSREERIEIFRDQLAEKIDFFLAIEPLVKSGIVHILPTEGKYSRRDPDGIYAGDFYGMEGAITATSDSPQHPLLSNEVRAYLEGQTKIKMPIRQGTDAVRLEDVTDCPNFIKILIGDTRIKEFRFFTVKTIKNSDESLHLQMFHSNDPFGQDIEPKMFQNWAKGSAEEVMIECVERLYNDTLLAQRAKARFLTDLSISHGLLRANLQDEKSVLGILNMELPFFDDVSFEAIAKARKNEVAFEDFRTAMDKALQEIPVGAEPIEFQKRLDELSRDLLRVPLSKIKKENERLARNIFTQGIVGVGTLGLYCIDPAFAVPGVLFTAANLFAGIYDKSKPNQDAIRDMPGYFYWSVTQKK